MWRVGFINRQHLPVFFRSAAGAGPAERPTEPSEVQHGSEERCWCLTSAPSQAHRWAARETPVYCWGSSLIGRKGLAAPAAPFRALSVSCLGRGPFRLGLVRALSGPSYHHCPGLVPCLKPRGCPFLHRPVRFFCTERNSDVACQI